MDYKNLVSLDFETYYASDYSLSLQSYNTSEYIRDEQFLIHGCGFHIHGHDAYYIRGHDEALRECQRLNLHEHPVLAHNMAFDGFILHEHADVHPLRYVDTLSMARATMGHHVLHNLGSVSKFFGFEGKIEGLVQTKGKRVLTDLESKILAEYCKNDVVQCAKVFWKLLEFMPEQEMELIDLTLRMFCQPELLVDIPAVQAERQKEIENKQVAVELAETEHAELMSNDKFAILIRELGVEPPMKISPTTGKQTYAFAKTDLGFQALLAHNDEAIQYVAQARVAVKSTLNETRAFRLEKAGEHGKPLPVLLNYAGAHTYRWSGGNKLNLQNLPRGGALRTAIHAPPNHQLLVADLAQIEARLNVWLCGQNDILQAFANGEDVYKVMAGKIYGKSIADVTKAERFIGKICVLGLGYGMGWKKLKATLAIGFAGPPVEISEQEARRIVTIYRAANPRIVAMWEFLSGRLITMASNSNLDVSMGPITFLYKMIELPSGLALKYPGLRVEESGWGSQECTYLNRYGRSKIYGGLLLENIVQALARCVIGEQMLALNKHGWKIATSTHDEVVLIVPDTEIKEAEKITRQIMSSSPVWAPDLPLAVDTGYDFVYSK
jgi:DNA polymerase